jgi:hypothetical protein
LEPEEDGERQGVPRRTRVWIALGIGVLGLGVSGSSGYSSPAPTLVGLHATYAVTSEGVGSIDVTSRGSDLTKQVNVETAEEQIESVVVGQSGGTLTVRSTITSTTSQPITAVYVMPVTSVVRSAPGQAASLPGGGVSFAQTMDIPLPDGQVRTLERSGQTDALWFTTIANGLTGGGPAFSMRLDLIDRSAPTGLSVPAGQALLLVPPLMSPTEAVVTRAGLHRALSAGGASTTTKAAATAATTTTWAESRLTTYDNYLADIRIWYSNFRHEGDFSSDPTTYAVHDHAVRTFPNWSVDDAKAWFGTVTPTYAQGYGSSDFSGVFVLGPFWRAHVSHEIDLSETTHQTWLNGKIETTDLLGRIFGSWCTWKTRQFYNGGTFASPTRQDASWYVIANAGEGVRLATLGC